MSKITIAIPTYNRPDFLAICIQSILQQTFQDFKIIVFDDISDFDIGNFLARFNNDSRISFLRSKERLGGNRKNFERIFRHQFESPYVMVFHDDDTMFPNFLRRLLDLMEAQEKLAWAGAGMRFVTNPSRMTHYGSAKEKRPVICKEPRDVVRFLLSGFPLAFGSVMYRSDLLEDIQPFFERFSKWCDRPFLLHLSRKGPVAIFPEVMMNYRLHGNQDSRASMGADSAIGYTENMFSYYLEQLPKPLSEKDEKIFYRFTSNNLLNFAGGIAGSVKDYFAVIHTFAEDGFFSWRYVGIKGAYRLIKSIGKILFKI